MAQVPPRFYQQHNHGVSFDPSKRLPSEGNTTAIKSKTHQLPVGVYNTSSGVLPPADKHRANKDGRNYIHYGPETLLTFEADLIFAFNENNGQCVVEFKNIRSELINDPDINSACNLAIPSSFRAVYNAKIYCEPGQSRLKKKFMACRFLGVNMDAGSKEDQNSVQQELSIMTSGSFVIPNFGNVHVNDLMFLQVVPGFDDDNDRKFLIDSTVLRDGGQLIPLWTTSNQTPQDIRRGMTPDKKYDIEPFNPKLALIQIFSHGIREPGVLTRIYLY